jgi:tetratricopeptide (TPR) repeat protein
VPPPPVRDESSAPALHREQLLWRQLTSACCIFAWRLARAGRFADSLGLLKKAEEVTEDERSPFVDRRELRAFYLDGFAHYYYRRNKGNAALDYAQKALRLHMQLGQWVHAAQTTLHVAAILYKLQRYDDCLRKLGKILVMVERGQLEDGGVSSQKIALVAVCYHNVAVTQLNLGQFQEACIASQNGRRLARLSLAYSNRWVEHMEYTHKMALAALCREQEFADVLRAQQAAGKKTGKAVPEPTTVHLSRELTATMFT